MGSPVRPVVVNLFMEKFEREALETAHRMSSAWYKYVNDNFIVWSPSEDAI